MNIQIAETASYPVVIRFITAKDAEDIVDFEGKSGTVTIRYNEKNCVLYIGIGDNDFSTEEVRNSIASAIRQICGLKNSKVSIELIKADDTAAAVEGVILGNYSFDKYRSEKPVHISDLELVNADESQLETAKTVAESVCFSRDLVNENAEIITPQYLADEAQKITDSCENISIEILTEKELVDQGLGLLYGVGKGSSTPPRLIIMNYNGAPESNERTAIIGKGVTFDTGGLNLKPSGSMETMRSDMSGAAAIFGVIKSLSELKPKINVVAVITSAQNAISNEAYYPGDILTGYDGTTVEVLNTDAEGRLCLADAISFTKKNYEPSSIINIATLTGAVVIALGDTIAGLFSNNPSLKDKVLKSAESSGEKLWELPIYKEHHEAIKSSIADLQNISKKARNASSITAAAFLQHFAGETPWCHLDVAGTSWNGGEAKGINNKYATGFGVRLILDHLLNN